MVNIEQEVYIATVEHLRTQQLRLIACLLADPTDVTVAQVLATFTAELAELERWGTS